MKLLKNKIIEETQSIYSAIRVLSRMKIRIVTKRFYEIVICNNFRKQQNSNRKRKRKRKRMKTREIRKSENVDYIFSAQIIKINLKVKK